MTQQTLGFEWKASEQRAALLSALRRSGCHNAAAEVLLLWVADCGGHRGLQRTAAEIASRLGCSARTARRHVARLARAGLLRVDEQRYRTGGSRENILKVDWEGVRAAAGKPPIPAGQNDRGAGQNDRGAGQNGSANKEHDPPSGNKNHLPAQKPPAAPATPASEAGEGGRLEAWPAVTQALEAAGVFGAAKLVRAVEGRLGPSDVVALLDYWRERPGAWTAGGLVWRIREGAARPELPVSCGWPEPAPSYSRQSRMRDREQRIQEFRERAAAWESEAETTRQRIADLEARHGQACDRMTPAEQSATVGLAMFTRLDVLEALERMESHAAQP